MNDAKADNLMNEKALDPSTDDEELEGLGEEDASWGDYPLDELLIRQESRTIHDVKRRIEQKNYVMDPDFQREFLWEEDKQSKLIESVIMRIPLPVFYMAEADQGRMVVVDGLQRLSTFHRFLANKLKLKLPKREKLNGLRFSDLPPKIQNRIEDCNLIFYMIDSRVAESARMEIFERVNGGVPLTRQQMRNALFMGEGTHFLRDEADTEIFKQATGASLSRKKMRDREFVNRFCAFRLLGLDQYRGDMDEFLADCLRQMNTMTREQLSRLSMEFRRGLSNNWLLFGGFAFRRHRPGQERRPVLNASFWDVMATGLSRYEESRVESSAEPVRESIYRLLEDEDFDTAIRYGPNDARKVRTRFAMTLEALQGVLGDYSA